MNKLKSADSLDFVHIGQATSEVSRSLYVQLIKFTCRWSMSSTLYLRMHQIVIFLTPCSPKEKNRRDWQESKVIFFAYVKLACWHIKFYQLLPLNKVKKIEHGAVLSLIFWSGKYWLTSPNASGDINHKCNSFDYVIALLFVFMNNNFFASNFCRIHPFILS